MIEPKRTVTVEPVNPSSPSLGPDPLTFWTLDRAANCHGWVGQSYWRGDNGIRSLFK